jgi:diguanylate cyclase (GGDEF)-like protein/PAS domain S-box-containing protein
MESELRVLIVEDAPADAALCERELRRGGLALTTLRVDAREDYERALEEFHPHLVLSDFNMPAFNGLAALELARRRVPEIPFIFVSGVIGEDRAVEAMRCGATDYVMKDRLERLVPVVRRALQEAQEREVARQAESALRASDARFRAVMEHLPGRAAIRDAEGRFQFVNETWERAFGVKAEAVIGRRYEDIFPAERAAELQAIDEEVARSGRAIRRVGQIDATRGGAWWLSTHFPIPDTHGGGVAGTATIAVDVTEQKEQEQKIARLSRIREVLSGINSAIARIRNRQELFVEACRVAVDHGRFGVAWVGLLDSASMEVTPVAWQGIAPDDFMNYRSAIRVAGPEPGGTVSGAIRERGPVFCNDLAAEADVASRRRLWIEHGYQSAISLPLYENNDMIGAFVLLAFEKNFFDREEVRLLVELAGDISFALDHIRHGETLHYLARHDGLTGLANGTLLADRLAQAVRLAQQRGGRVAVVVLCIRRFHLINDTFGRQAGDLVLREFAGRLKAAWPEPENVARLNGDLFAGLVTHTPDGAQIALFLENPPAPLGAPFVVKGSEVGIALAAGIALFPDDGSGADVLVRNAEAALKQAKASGERYFFYRPEMNATIPQTLMLESRVRHALEREEFVVHYQPKMNLSTEAISGIEALIRWQDPQTGLVPPARFLPILEESGMILEAQEWAIGRALADHKAWATHELASARVSVNISPLQLRQRNFVEKLLSMIERSGASPGALELEVTEGMIMEDLRSVAAKLGALRKAGVSIAIDGFGAGYSSLSHLATLPVDTVKIDRSFIATAVSDPDSMTIVSSIISLAHSLRLRVVAVGVSSADQVQLLKLLRCDEAQGFWLSEAVPASHLSATLGQRTAARASR